MDHTSVPVPTQLDAPRQLDSISLLLSQTWQWFNAHFTKLFQISLLFLGLQVFVAFIMVTFGLFALSETSQTTPSIASGLGIFLAAISIGLVFALLSLWNSVALYTYIIRNDQTYTIRQVISDSRTMILPFFSTSLLVGLITLLGVLLLILPGIYWGVLYGFAPLITLVEGKNVRALERSKFLVKGHWWPVFWRQVVIGLLVYVISYVLLTILSTFITALSSLYKPLSSLSDVGGFFSNTLFAPISLIFTYLLYQNLRRLKG